MTEFKRNANDCRFTYVLDFILKPRGKLEYYENTSLSKFEGNSSIDTCRKLCWKIVCAQRIWRARKLFCQPHTRVILTHVIENDVSVCKQRSTDIFAIIPNLQTNINIYSIHLGIPYILKKLFLSVYHLVYDVSVLTDTRTRAAQLITYLLKRVQTRLQPELRHQTNTTNRRHPLQTHFTNQWRQQT